MLPGWDRITTVETSDATDGAVRYNITLNAGVAVEDFDEPGFDERLRGSLHCTEPTCSVAVGVAAASLNVRAAITDTVGSSVAATNIP